MQVNLTELERAINSIREELIKDLSENIKTQNKNRLINTTSNKYELT